MGRFKALLAVIAGALALMSVAVVQGRPSYFYDTDDYYLHGRMIARSIGLHPPAEAFDPESGVSIVDQKMHPDPRLAFTFLGGRSAFYSVLLYALERAGTLWSLVAVQALAASACLMLLAQAASRRWLAPFATLIGVLTIGSSLPFFVAFAMPDLFAGLVVALAGLVLFYWDRMSAARRAAALALYMGGLIFHLSHIVDAAIAAGLGAALAMGAAAIPPRQALARAGLLMGGAVAALALMAGVSAIAERHTGYPLRSPPFLAARVLADGPGRQYLRVACARGERLELCRFKDLPLEDSDDILSSDDLKLGIFRVSGYEVRERIARQEPGFVLAGVLHHPIAQALASLRNGALQSAMSRVEEPLLTPSAFTAHWYWNQTRMPALIARSSVCVFGEGRCVAKWPQGVLKLFQGAVLLAALGVLIWRGRRLTKQVLAENDDLRRARALMLFFLAMVLANALVCGALSGPFPRYEARLIWLIAAAAVLLEFAVRRWAAEAGETERERAIG